MINRKTRNLGVNCNVGIDPSSAASSTNNFNSNVYIQTPYPGEADTAKVSTFKIRDISETELEDINTGANQHSDQNEVRGLILETYANILLNQDKALIANLISKHTIIIPMSDLRNIIQLMTNGEVEIQYDEDCSCCGAKVSFIKKIEAIKIIKDDNIIITDFKQVFNKEYNDLVNKYHLNLKYVLVC